MKYKRRFWLCWVSAQKYFRFVIHNNKNRNNDDFVSGYSYSLGSTAGANDAEITADNDALIKRFNIK